MNCDECGRDECECYINDPPCQCDACIEYHADECRCERCIDAAADRRSAMWEAMD